MNLKNKRIIISKINQIGDVTFSLPLASAIKKAEPTCTIIFLGREYSRALIESYADVDEFADWQVFDSKGLVSLRADIIIHVVSDRAVCAAAKKAGISIRIANARQFRTIINCNRFVYFSRNKSYLHESQLDMKFLAALGLKSDYSVDDIIALRHYKPTPKTAVCLNLLHPAKFNLILHPKTRGNHIEWSPRKFFQLITLLPQDQFNIFVTGSESEGQAVRDVMIKPFPWVNDLTGKTSLDDLIQFIAHADGLMAASTGPLHVAANFDLYTLGLYSLRKPQYALRWGPIGRKAVAITAKQLCTWCQQSSMNRCDCLETISAQEVADFFCVAACDKNNPSISID